MRYWVIYVITVIISLGAFLYLTAVSVNKMPSSEVSEAVVLGKKVWQQNGCVECHTMFGDGGYNAPDLTHEASRRNANWLQSFFRNRTVMRPAKSNRHLGLNSEDTNNLIKYLQFVNRIKMVNWPPKPLK